MFKNVLFGLTVALVSSMAFSGVATAQSTDASSLSAEELEDLFKKQKTRGLVLAPTNAEDNTANSVEEDVAPKPAQETYVELAPEEQVQIQISFDFDSAALRADQKPKLATLCTVMQNSDIGEFRIVGHTDTSGSASYNERLSLLRAEEVKRFMVSDCGVAEDRLKAVGVGEAFPLDKNDPQGDVNRRVEFQALS